MRKSINKSINKKNDNQPLSLNERLQEYLDKHLTKEQKEEYETLCEKYKNNSKRLCKEFWCAGSCVIGTPEILEKLIPTRKKRKTKRKSKKGKR